VNKEITNQSVGDGRGGWRFALFYFLSFAGISLYAIYGSLYFKRRGVSNIELGILYAISAWVGIFAPLAWGLISDMIRKRKIPNFIMHITAAALFPMFWFWKGGFFWLLCLLMAIFTFFFRGGIPLADAWTLDHIQKRGGDYGKIRSWGSAGFAISIFVSLFILRQSSMSKASDLLPVFIAFCTFRILSAFYILTLPDYHSQDVHPKLQLKNLRVYLRPFAITFFLAVFMSRFLFEPYYTFFSIFLDEQGVPDNLKGIYWMVAVGSETGLIAISGYLLRRFGAVKMLLAGLSAMAFRMFVYSLEPSWYFIMATQTLHALTFGAFHVASIQIINRITPDEFRASGQTFNGALLGTGGIMGDAVAGIISHNYGLAKMFRLFSIIAALTVFILIILFSIWREGENR
jgi:PPP family 3-phenylpropionic acid transporter